MADLQSMVDTLSALEEESLVNVISSVLQARPEVAPPVVNFSIPDLTYPPSRALTERRSQGMIKSFNMNNGFGFIDCPELYAVFGNDVFLHNKQLGGRLGEFGPGTPVTFAVCLSKDNKPQAYDVQLLGGGMLSGGKGCCGGGCKGKGDCCGGMMMAPSFDMMQMQMMKGKGWGCFKGKPDEGKGCCKGKWGASKGKGSEDQGRRSLPPGAEPFQELGHFTGHIKSFNPKSGYGFITCGELQNMGFNNDCFLHHQQMGDCNVGDEVTFLCYLNSKGQPQAKDVSLEDGSHPQKRSRTS